MSTQEMHEVIRELKEYKILEEECRARIAELENIVKTEMRTQDTDKMIIGEYKCSLAVVTSNRVDSKTLKEELPDIFTKYSKASSYERLTVR